MFKFKYVSQGSLKTLSSSAEPITSRSLRLNQVFQVKLCTLYTLLCCDTNTCFVSNNHNRYRPAVSSWLPVPPFVCCPQGRVSLCGQHGGRTVGREEFLEALLLLYQECTSPELMKVHHVAKFVNKCKPMFYTCGRVICCFWGQSIWMVWLSQLMCFVQLLRDYYSNCFVVFDGQFTMCTVLKWCHENKWLYFVSENYQPGNTRISYFFWRSFPFSTSQINFIKCL